MGYATLLFFMGRHMTLLNVESVYKQTTYWKVEFIPKQQHQWRETNSQTGVSLGYVLVRSLKNRQTTVGKKGRHEEEKEEEEAEEERLYLLPRGGRKALHAIKRKTKGKLQKSEAGTQGR
jgi:hypothetical protein